MLRVTLLGLCVVAGISMLGGRGDRTWIDGRQKDFLAFYCAGSSVAGGHDPYLAEPLRSCELAALRAAHASYIEHLAIPAPLPGYTLAFFSLFARLPFAQAAMLFTLMLIAALVATLLALRELTGQPLLAIFGTLVLCDGWVCLAYGQIVPLALMCICLAARCLAMNRPLCAAVFSAGAMIEPHVALPACIALFLFERRARIALVICAALLCWVSMFRLGCATNVEYVVRVLPTHALAESNQIEQFSLTRLLHWLGLNASVALRLADLSYIAMVAIGMCVARRLAAHTRRCELLVLFPPACALLGGPFVHNSQMVAAVPALLVLVQCFAGRRTLFTVALLFVAIPWLELSENSLAAVVIAAFAVATVVSLSSMRTRLPQMLFTITTMTAIALTERLIRMAFPPIHLNSQPELARAAGGSLLADATWAIWVRSELGDQWYIASHAPTWIGLILMVSSAIVLSRRSSLPLEIASVRSAPSTTVAQNRA